jgi:pilus assembly protein FimV
MLGVGGASAIILLSLSWVMVRRRREAEDQFQESALLAASDGTTVELEQESAVARRPEPAEETSFISDFSPSDIDALQEETGEVDPAAEADVYIAYGRYQQAEGLVKQAIEKAPERLDLRLKLLEIYFTTRNAADFIALAEELEREGAEAQDVQLWERVKSMGQELAPDHRLFARVVQPEASELADLTDASALASGSEPLHSDSDSLANFDLSLEADLAAESALGTPGAAGAAPDDNARPEDKTQRRGHELDEDSGLVLDLEDLSSLESSLDDLQFGAPGEGAAGGDSPRQRPATSGGTTSPDSLSSMSVSKTALPPEEEDIPAFSLDDLDLEGSDFADSVPVDGLTGLDEADESEEVETKLDLARAYWEMGDGDGAREILEEVLTEGSDMQKVAAQELMEQMG